MLRYVKEVASSNGGFRSSEALAHHVACKEILDEADRLGKNRYDTVRDIFKRKCPENLPYLNARSLADLAALRT